MDFWEKLQRRAAEVNKAKVSRAVGLPPNAISSYIAKRSMPRADIAAKMARALEVPLEWLLNDALDWPPPKPDADIQGSLQNVPFGPLIRELARRYRLEALDTMRLLDKAKKTDWTKALSSLTNWKPEQPLPLAAAQLIRLFVEVHGSVTTTVMRYNVQIATDFLHDQLPGAELPLESLSEVKALGDLLDLPRLPGFQELGKWMKDHPEELQSINVTLPPAITQLFDLLNERKRIAMLGGTPPPEVPKGEQAVAETMQSVHNAIQRAAKVIESRDRTRNKKSLKPER